MIVVCARGATRTYADIAEAIADALQLAAQHIAVGMHLNEEGARRMVARAFPGMVVCPRIDAFSCVDCYPLSEATALVRSSSSRSPVARTLRSITPRAMPLAPTTI